ncbi:phosphotransferase [Kribbella sp. NPDC051770]|uniref:phosphotransferase n=1 Tax=Kribbella sp. NPDC051770 TaxID=3155413 RepID=UPI003413677E
MGDEVAAGTDQTLVGGRNNAGVVRRGETVRRAVGAASPVVHAYLRHLEAAGFEGAPRVLGVEDRVEVLSWLPGEVPADPEWTPGKGNPLTAAMRSEEALAEVGRLLRRLHEASAGFVPPDGLRAGEVMSHGDLGPWNTVYRDGLPVAFIDWDACGASTPLLDVAAAAWAFVPLASEQELVETGFEALPDLGRRLRVLADAYGLEERVRLVPALVQAKLRAAGQVEGWGLGARDSAVSLEFYARELRWLETKTEELELALR